MPYITKRQREDLGLWKDSPGDPGELNYAITVLLDEYMQHQGLRYQTINDIVGALEGAKLEFYRRIAAPYEDAKIVANGDVYTTACRGSGSGEEAPEDAPPSAPPERA